MSAATCPGSPTFCRSLASPLRERASGPPASTPREPVACRRTHSELSDMPTTRWLDAGESATLSNGAAYLSDPTTCAVGRGGGVSAGTARGVRGRSAGRPRHLVTAQLVDLDHVVEGSGQKVRAGGVGAEGGDRLGVRTHRLKHTPTAEDVPNGHGVAAGGGEHASAG